MSSFQQRILRRLRCDICKPHLLHIASAENARLEVKVAVEMRLLTEGDET